MMRRSPQDVTVLGAPWSSTTPSPQTSVHLFAPAAIFGDSASGIFGDTASAIFGDSAAAIFGDSAAPIFTSPETPP